MKTNIKTRFILLLFLFVTCIVVFLGVKYLIPYFLPFIIAYWFAKYAYPVSLCLHVRFHFPKSIACIITLLLFASIVGIILYYLISTLICQLETIIENFPMYKNMAINQVQSMCNYCDCALKMECGTTHGCLIDLYNSLSLSSGGTILPNMTRQTLFLMTKTAKACAWSFICVFSALLILLDYDGLKENYRKTIFYKDINRILKKLSVTGLRYLKMQFVIIGVISVICTAGLFLEKNPYALLLGITIAILDALPLFGSGTILVPWAVIKLFSHNIPAAAILMSTYLFAQVTRQFLESKLLGNSLGLPPVYFVMSLFIGIELFGVIGFLLGPFSLLLIKIIYTTYKPCFLQR